MNKWLYGFCAAIIVLALLLHALDWAARRGNSLPPVPNPNSYEDLLAIAGEVKLPEGDLIDLGNARIRELALTNSAPLGKLRAVLDAKGAVPLKTERGWSDKHTQELKNVKRLAVALGLQSRAHLLEGRTNDALRCHLEMVLLGQFIPHGGLLPDAVTGLALETLGAASMRGDLPMMDAKACRDFAKELETAEQRREPSSCIWDTEKRWAASTFGMSGRLVRLVLRVDDAKRRAELTKRSDQVIRRTRRLTLILAARAFELETGKPPAKPADLVPAYLSAVPVDPVAGAPFTEVPKDTESG